jgi:hypothetical protein
MSVADDYGRYYATAKLLRAACYPLQIDKVSDADIGKWISECETAGLVSVYPASDGKRYLEIRKFGQQVRAKSKFPPPAESEGQQLISVASNGKQTPANEHLDVFVSEDVSEDGKRSQAIAGLPDWLPVDEWEAFVAMRRAKGKRAPFTDKAREGILSRLGRFRESGYDVAEILAASTRNGWSDVFEPKGSKPETVGNIFAGAM